MHCPSCGQQQVSTETKFCSKCGLPLGVVSEVLAHGGFLPQLAHLNKKSTVFNKKNGVVFGTFWFIFFTLFCTAFFGILDAPERLIGILAITGVFGTMMIMIASLIFLPSSKTSFAKFAALPTPNNHGLPRYQQNQALPPQQSMPASAYTSPQAGNWRDTSDLQPTSITEGTTRLLDKDELP